ARSRARIKTSRNHIVLKGFADVLRNAPSVFVHLTNPVLCFLTAGFAIPFHRHGKVLWDALTVEVHFPQTQTPKWISILLSDAIPLDCFGIVPSDTLPIAICIR